ncbi:MAG: hypothetical protein US50_C0042G0005 [Candidatus Nomurabacteria bacterium GW2011_GWB1_37_5]|uniref:Uncharacterized protein n=1 Tax=Candidatus Nomurabacteria bacterium GW2011_GWB1_37_5 TaxID=1618742 RepID=A0A0G0K1W2_9BACT|nr:MAG: hypothetical protein US50_C0042G0005 [Candidatus Nomurabacteria bacterium GW2011_GWB1_37_5]
MKLNCFMKLKNDYVLFAIHQDDKTGVVHGYSLTSPFLKIKSYNLKEIDQNWKDTPMNIAEFASIILRKNPYDIESTKCKCHGPKITKTRYMQIVEIIKTKMASATEIPLIPLHESILNLLQKVKTFESLEMLCLLIIGTKIPKNHEKIIEAIEQAEKRTKSSGEKMISWAIVNLMNQAELHVKKEEAVS